jgi:serine/threonine protein kinase
VKNNRDENLLEPVPRPENSIKFTELEDANKSLGQGTFANVRLVLHKDTNTYYALKAMRKADLIAHKLQSNVIAEKKIMLACDCPFIVKLYRAFQDTDHLYMLLEYIEGGELFNVIHVPGRDGLTNSQAKFYAAGVAIALAYLHSKEIAYRDLKPENIIMDRNGYPKVTDFGFAKLLRNGNKTYTLCGTPEYIAPEVVIGSGHSMAVDHWGLGILIFEMQTGYTPFSGPPSPTHEEVDNFVICERVVKGQLTFPTFFDPMCKVSE